MSEKDQFRQKVENHFAGISVVPSAEVPKGQVASMRTEEHPGMFFINEEDWKAFLAEKPRFRRSRVRQWFTVPWWVFKLAAITMAGFLSAAAIASFVLREFPDTLDWMHLISWPVITILLLIHDVKREGDDD